MNEKKSDLPKEKIQEWVDALRSGDYIQTTGRLCRDDGSKHKTFCCLGVLCDLVDPGGWRDGGAVVSWYDCINYPGQYFPNEFDGIFSELWKRNDGHQDLERNFKYDPHTFEEIASIIEERLLT